MDKEDYIKFSEADMGSTLTRPVLVSSINENVARNGKPFVKLTLKDGFSEQVATMFDTTAEDLEQSGISKNTVADVELSVGEYQGSKSFKVNSIRPNDNPLLSINDFTKVPPFDMDFMYDKICELIKDAADKNLRKYTPLSELALHILSDYKKRYMTSSASVTMHHNLRGGLLYHSYRMVRTANAICSIYSLDRELMLCGAALHDIGKIWEYDTSATGDAEFTASGVLFGHLYLGASLIKKYTEGKNYNREKVQLLIHMILSHHGTQEWGAVACPSIPEAFALHYIDNLDAKMYVCEEFYEQLDPGAISEKRPFGLDNRIYRPRYDV